MTKDILTENKIDFKSLERKCFEEGCRSARELMKNFFQEVDRYLMQHRDKGIYRHKGHRKTCLKTLMGEVEYSRAIYEVTDGSLEHKFVYLLDEYMQFDCIGFVSANLAEQIAENACEASYANTAKNISELTGQRISHTGAWNVVQKLGESIDKLEQTRMSLNKSHQLKGQRETKILFEEADGVFVKLQGKLRTPKHKSCEIKLAMFHEGWKQTGTNRYELSEKTILCGMETGCQFNARKEAMIAEKYNVDEIETRIFNADGGQWIKKLYSDDAETLFQLDPFHIRKALKSSSPGGEYDKTVLGYLKEGNIKGLFRYLEAVADSLENSSQEEKVRGFCSYLRENSLGLVPYQKRLSGPSCLNDGLVYRNMGNCEHAVYIAVAKRMKHRGATWSPQGSLNLCKLLCLKASHHLSETLKKISDAQLPERFNESVTAGLYSAGKSRKIVGKGYELKNCHMPFFDAAVTESRKVFKKMIFEY